MYKKHGQFYFSPSDLTRYMESPFASWMDRFAIECPEHAPEKDSDDPLMASLSQKGFDHENAVQAAFVEKGLSLEIINDGLNKEKYENTLAAIEKGVDVIAQARLELEPFGGYADFLVKESHCDEVSTDHSREYYYEVWDAKLSSTPKPAFVIQLCCYAEMLVAVQGYRPEFITIALGNGKKERLRTNDFYYYYQTLKSSFLNEQKCFNPTDKPRPRRLQKLARLELLCRAVAIGKRPFVSGCNHHQRADQKVQSSQHIDHARAGRYHAWTYPRHQPCGIREAKITSGPSKEKCGQG